ncbi:uncharacterized protein LOC143447379 [Clavelina lepadiformis]|uniref:uncharacterized protein LOC143447379 n=1 Tax=Clavelina lepadiformis TaxID=159417 RepID=UPI0040436043
MASADVKQFSAKEIFCNVKDSVLGRGGFGTVLLGHHRVLGKVAVKCKLLQGTQKEAENSKKELLKEIKMMILARHKFVVDVHGVIDQDNFIGLVMEHMPAGSLSDFILNKQVKNIPIPLLVRMNYETSDGITYLHKLFKDQRIAHGDLKPSNILLDSDFHCKIADFGGAALSHHTLTFGGTPDKTDEGKQLTPIFTAPERMDLNCKRLTTSMDVYSFGVVLYMSVARKYPAFPQMLIKVMQNENPFKADLNQVKNKHKGNNEATETLSLLEIIMMKCVDQDPSKRPSMIEIRDQLQQQLNGIKHTTMAGHVVKVSAHVGMKNNELDKHACKPIKQVILRNEPEHFADSGINEEQTVSGKSLSNLTIKARPKEKPKPDPGYDLIQARKRAINNLLTQNRVDDAIAECHKLLSLVKVTSLSHDQAITLGSDIIKLVEALLQKQFSNVLINLLESVSFLHKWIEQPDVKIELVKQYVRKAVDCGLHPTPDFERKQRFSQLLITYMDDVLEIITSTASANKKLVVKTEADRFMCSGICQRNLKNSDEAIDVNMRAIRLLESVLGEDCVKLSVYAACCNNVATNYGDKGQNKEALRFYLKSHYAYRVTVDNEDEEKWRKNQFITLSNICLQYEDNPTFDKDKAEEIFGYLQEQYLTGFPHFMKTLMTLRLAIILKRKVDQRRLCDMVVRMANSISPPSDQYFELCNQAERIVKNLFREKLDKSASSLLRCAVQFWKCIPKEYQKLDMSLHLSNIISETVNDTSFSSPLQRTTISSDFISLCNELFKNLENVSYFDQFRKPTSYQGFVLKAQSHCYVTINNYKECLRTARESIRLFSLDTECKTPNRENMKGELHFLVGVSKNNLGDFNGGKTSLLEAVKVFESVPDEHRNQHNIEKCWEHIKFLEKKQQTQ